MKDLFTIIVFLFFVKFISSISLELEFGPLNSSEIEEILRELGPTRKNINEIEFHHAWVPDIKKFDKSCIVYNRLSSSMVIIDKQVTHITDDMQILFGSLSHFLKPLQENLLRINSTIVLLDLLNEHVDNISTTFLSLKAQLVDNMNNIDVKIYEKNGIVPLWEGIIVDTNRNVNNIIDKNLGFMKFIHYKFTPSVVFDTILFFLFFIFLCVYISRFFPREKVSFERILDSFAIPGIILFFVASGPEIVLGFIVIFDLKFVNKFFVKSVLSTLFILIAFFLFLQFNIVLFWLVFKFVKVVRLCLKKSKKKENVQKT